MLGKQIYLQGVPHLETTERRERCAEPCRGGFRKTSRPGQAALSCVAQCGDHQTCRRRLMIYFPRSKSPRLRNGADVPPSASPGLGPRRDAVPSGTSKHVLLVRPEPRRHFFSLGFPCKRYFSCGRVSRPAATGRHVLGGAYTCLSGGMLVRPRGKGRTTKLEPSAPRCPREKKGGRGPPVVLELVVRHFVLLQ